MTGSRLDRQIKVTHYRILHPEYTGGLSWNALHMKSAQCGVRRYGDGCMIQGSRRRSKDVASAERGRMGSDSRRAVSYIVRGELSFLFFTAVCVALHPGFVLKWNEGGMSNYGLHLKTAIPYTLALALLALFSGGASRLYARGDNETRRLSLLLRLYSTTVLLVLLSSYFYSLNVALKDVHYVASTALLVLVGLASLWIYRQWPRTNWGRLLLLVQLAGDVLALLTIGGKLHFLFAAEILSNVGFAGLLIRTGRRAATDGYREATA